MYAGKITDSMRKTIDATNYRREKQMKFNIENNITPRQIVKPTREIIGYEFRSGKTDARNYSGGADHTDVAADPVVQYMSADALKKPFRLQKNKWKLPQNNSDFIEAARLRDEMYSVAGIAEGEGEKERLRDCRD